MKAMDAPTRSWSQFLLVLAALILTVLVTWPLVYWTMGPSPSEIVDAIQKRGGVVASRSSGTRDSDVEVIGIDLSRASVDSALVQLVMQCPRIERLNLEGATLNVQDWALLGKLPNLRSLILFRSNVTDADLTQIPRTLNSLSLNATAVTDACAPSVAEMTGLASLDICGTKMTANCLEVLEPLKSLKLLRLDQSCVSAKGTQYLRRMRPQCLEVAISDDAGFATFQLLSACEGIDIRGLHSRGYQLWKAQLPWSHSLAGVVEAVVKHAGLDAQQATQLLDLFGQRTMEPWGPATPVPLEVTAWSTPRDSAHQPGFELTSAEELIGELQKDRAEIDWLAVHQYVRDRFSDSDLPFVIRALDALKEFENWNVLIFSPFLLVQYGHDNPEIRAEVERLLAHREQKVRQGVVCAFGYAGASPIYRQDEWKYDADIGEWAVRVLPAVCRDKNELEYIRDTARKILTETALAQPELAPEVLPVLVELLDEQGTWVESWNDPRHLATVDVPRVAEVNPQAALSIVPRLREMWRQLDLKRANPTPDAPQGEASPYTLGQREYSVLVALSAAAHYDPSIAREIAAEYLRRMKAGQQAGPFEMLLSPETRETNREVVLELLQEAAAASDDSAGVPPLAYPFGDPTSRLAALAKKIRDWTEGQAAE
jgi:hypothetical protein